MLSGGESGLSTSSTSNEVPGYFYLPTWQKLVDPKDFSHLRQGVEFIPVVRSSTLCVPSFSVFPSRERNHISAGILISALICNLWRSYQVTFSMANGRYLIHSI